MFLNLLGDIGVVGSSIKINIILIILILIISYIGTYYNNKFILYIYIFNIYYKYIIIQLQLGSYIYIIRSPA